MTGAEFYRLLVDYGPIVAVLSFLFLGGVFLVVAFKPASRFFLAVNTILEMPAKFTDLVTRLNKQDEVASSKQTAIEDLSVKVTDSNARLEEHIRDARAQTAAFDRDMRPRLETLIVNSEIAAHELRHNGGGSVKDDARFARDKIDRIESLLLQLQQQRPPTGPIPGP